MKRSVLVDLQYLPSLEFFTLFEYFDEVIIERFEHFEKQSYRNRAHILSSNQVTTLSIPVIGGNRKLRIDQIEIDYNQRWLGTHWRGIVSAYGKAPYFEYFASFFEKVFHAKHQRLFELNIELLTLCLRLLGHDKMVSYSDKYEKQPEEGVLDLRSVIHPKKAFGQNTFYRPYSYIQLFGKDFVPNLSIIDLLFCEGPNARNVIQQSMVQ